MHEPHSRRAFSLVELMIVIALLAILAALVIPRFGSASNQARTTGTERTLQTVRGQLENYRNRENEYPPSVVAGTDWSDMIDSDYLIEAPRNPLLLNQTSISSGSTVTPGDPVPGGAAWYWDTDMQRLHAADEDGNLYDF